jgi:hypothetical protein
VASSISKIENGTRKLVFDEAIRLAKAFGIELEALAAVEAPALPQLALAAQSCRVIRDELTVITQQVNQLEQVLTVLKEHSGDDVSHSFLSSRRWDIPCWSVRLAVSPRRVFLALAHAG